LRAETPQSPVSERRTLASLTDPFNRRFSYLRLSVTDACNFGCSYCLPGGYSAACSPVAPLLPAEIRNLVAAFAELGVSKVRLTGGEPTLRRDILEIARTISETPGIRTVAVTTNGYQLKKLAEPLFAAGVNALNVSVDSLDPDVFMRITGARSIPFANIVSGIDEALLTGFRPVKINVVLLRGVNDSELTSFIEWSRTKPVHIRFIELMRTAQNGDLFARHHVSTAPIRERLLREGWIPKPREVDDGPAREFIHGEFLGSIGIISPYVHGFCASCNRLRVTSRGDLRLCLFGEADEPLRPFLRDSSQRGELIERILSALREKPRSHLLNEGKYGNTENLSSIGG